MGQVRLRNIGILLFRCLAFYAVFFGALMAFMWVGDHPEVGAIIAWSLIAGLPLAALIAVVWFAWPTPWRYERPSGHVVRIRRRTGEAQILTPVGWQPLDGHGLRLPE